MKPLSEEMQKKKYPTGKELAHMMNKKSAMRIAQDDPIFGEVSLNPNYSQIEYWNFYAERMKAGFGIDVFKYRIFRYFLKMIEIKGKTIGVHGKDFGYSPGVDVSTKLYMRMAGIEEEKQQDPGKPEPKYTIGTRESFKETSINEQNNMQKELETMQKLQNEVLYLETKKKELREDIAQIRSSKKQGKNNE